MTRAPSSVVAGQQRLPGGIWAMGFASLLMDTSSELVQSLLPVFIVTVLGASVVAVGVIEGVAGATAEVVKVFSAYPAGALVDRVAVRPVLVAALLVLLASHVLLARATTVAWVFAGAALWGLHMGSTQGLLSKLVADTARADLRGTAFGVFNLVSGVGVLLASLIAGGLWSGFGPRWTFLAGAGFAAVAALGLLLARPPR